MKRDIDLKEISDGNLYTLNDMVKADCNDCKGCSACCHGMGTSIILDPMDVYRISQGTGLGMQELLNEHLELNVVDGIILPNLKLAGESEACSFLNAEGRCSIHAYRPGICRLFPLGRIYEDGVVKYFLQVHECKKDNRTKVKVKKWLQIPESKKYEQYVLDWHNFMIDLQELINEKQDDTFHKNLTVYVLQQFYLKPYDIQIDFYEQFYLRLEEAKRGLCD